MGDLRPKDAQTRWRAESSETTRRQVEDNGHRSATVHWPCGRPEGRHGTRNLMAPFRPFGGELRTGGSLCAQLCKLFLQQPVSRLVAGWLAAWLAGSNELGANERIAGRPAEAL